VIVAVKLTSTATATANFTFVIDRLLQKLMHLDVL